MSARLTWLAFGAALVLGASACGSTPITSGRLDASVAATFANLWVYHEEEVGHPHPAAPALDSRAACQKGTPTGVQAGAGSDWVCHVTWLVDGPGTPVTANYNLQVQTDGCYTADGDGPASVNGAPTLADLGAGSRVNPLWAFNGCFDTT